MVTEETVKGYLKRALKPYIKGYRYYRNHGGYFVKAPVYGVDESDLPDIQSKLKYGEVSMVYPSEDAWCLNPHLTLTYVTDDQFILVSEYGICAKEIGQVDDKNGYGVYSGMLAEKGIDDPLDIALILKQTEKGVQVLFDTPNKDFKMWFPKTAIYWYPKDSEKVESEGGVVPKDSAGNYKETWYVIPTDVECRSDDYWTNCRGWEEYEDRFFRNRMCYGDAEHYDRRIENLVKNDGYIPYKKIRIVNGGGIMHIALMVQKDRVEAGSMICNEYLSRETRKCAVVYLE